MKKNYLSKFFKLFQKNTRQNEFSESESPLRDDLYSSAQMEKHGSNVASRHKLSNKKRSNELLRRLAENEAVIVSACEILTESAKQDLQITPAATWLVDNFYLIKDQIRMTKHHFPKNYCKELPRLTDDCEPGKPRAYEIAIEIISHGDGRIDTENIGLFVRAYQSVSSLTLGELWAIPIMLKIGLIENLRRFSRRIITTQENRKLAISWADKMISTAEDDPSSLILLVADMSRTCPVLQSSFVAELVRRLQGRAPTLTLPLNWLSQHLAEHGQTIEKLVRMESQHQAADQISVSNSIHSLRMLTMTDWRHFVESTSQVEEILYLDPPGVYSSMDFQTRDNYRHIVEKLAIKSGLTETIVAQELLNIALDSAKNFGIEDRKAHIGYFLIDNGISVLRNALKIKNSVLDLILLNLENYRLLAYLAVIHLICISVTFGIAFLLIKDNYLNLISIILFFSCWLICGQFAVSIVNWQITRFAKPKILPRMNFLEGIPEDCQCVTVIAVMLGSEREIDEITTAIEIYFLANQDTNLRFCILSDFIDADKQILDSDASLQDHAKRKIDALNLKYPRQDGSFFLFLHRARNFNPQENIWMSFERKRGKLNDFNDFLRDSGSKAFTFIAGDVTNLEYTKYVITLDSDTQLPRGAAMKLISAMAHPLNKPIYNSDFSRVIEGYGILQPRVAVGLNSITASIYELLYSSDTGTDPYTRSVSDVYQDIFGEGSFIGKGIYDVCAFERVLKGKMPDNRILSHDLLEGGYIRAGLLSDTFLIEAYPANYLSDVKRRHRWVRGDWQISSWLLSSVPSNVNSPSGKIIFQENPLSLLSKWKLLDNLRRSILPLAYLVFLVIGWFVANDYDRALFVSIIVLLLVLTPLFFSLALQLILKPEDVNLKCHVREQYNSSRSLLLQAILNISFIPYEAYIYTDAIIRTHWRLFVSHQNLLQWNPWCIESRVDKLDFIYVLKKMWVAPLIALAVAIFLLSVSIFKIYAALPLLILWFLSPLFAYKISLPRLEKFKPLEIEKTEFLQRLSRKTWLFFETYVGPNDNWLPPDNVQEYPVKTIAHRTSPTNIGLYLLANLAASDFGYISYGILISRTRDTLLSLHKMERYQGHFFNWYDTLTLSPMQPLYISTVDSGNLSAHLLTLKSGMTELAELPFIPTSLFNGLHDTFLLLKESSPEPYSMRLLAIEFELDYLCNIKPKTKITSIYHSLIYLRYLTAQLQSEKSNNRGMENWLNSLIQQYQIFTSEILLFCPWAIVGEDQLCIKLFPVLAGIPTLTQIASCLVLEPDFSHATLNQIMHKSSDSVGHVRGENTARLVNIVRAAAERACERISEIESLCSLARELSECQYQFLYNKTTHLLSIGYNLSERRLDTSYYDLLASEARLATFVGIAQGKIPQESWYALGRQLTVTGGEPVLLSWSGSMFEYLMPLLVMPSYPNTLLGQTYQSAVRRQIQYGKKHNVPWGISESGYYAFDRDFNYQYRAFGVPGLGFRHGLIDDLVIAPYATLMALMIIPDEACDNLLRMARSGFIGEYGFYEAIDFTVPRLLRGQQHVIIRSFMTHHQGMALLSLAYHLLGQPLQRRFNAEPLLKAAVPLLHEKIPRATLFYANTAEFADVYGENVAPSTPMRVLQLSNNQVPDIQLLSNGRYHVMISSAGGGYSRWRNVAITRWIEDSTCDNTGIFCYVYDVESGQYWSTTFQPTQKKLDGYQAVFSEGRAEFRGSDNLLDMHTEIVVSPEDDTELRRTRIVNRSSKRRTLQLTSYAEVVLASQKADQLHPAFSKLFVQTEILPEYRAILCERRTREDSEKIPVMFHLMALHGVCADDVSYETSREIFIGRGHTLSDPVALNVAGKLSNSMGSVLDPIVAIRYHISLDPEQTVLVDLVTGVAETKESCLHLIEKYRDQHLSERVVDLSWTHNQVVLRQLNITENEAQLYTRLASSVIYANPLMRASQDILVQNRRGQSALWSYAISGDLPIVLLQISQLEHLELARQLIQAHALWQSHGLAVDLVIWNEDHASYRQVLHEHILALISTVIGAHTLEKPGGIFVRMTDKISNEDRILFQSYARVILNDQRGSLEDQLERSNLGDSKIREFIPSKTINKKMMDRLQKQEISFSDKNLFENGHGGFSEDGKEYWIRTNSSNRTPAPWVNVIANPLFGSIISESGQSYTWSANAHEFRLTPWNNDPVSDSGGEIFYLRDEENGVIWTPTALPCTDSSDYLTRHGFGYSIFTHRHNDIHSELTVYVDLKEPIKYMVLNLRNLSDSQRKISVTGYIEWVLGDLRNKSAMHVVSALCPDGQGITAKNYLNNDFSAITAFFSVNQSVCAVTGDRAEFIGRNGSLRSPVAMKKSGLSGKTGAGFDPCAALQTVVDIKPRDEQEIVFVLGISGEGEESVSAIAQKHRQTQVAKDALETIRLYWEDTLSVVHVNTPDMALNILTNGWLLYQTISCRLWARSGYYQSGGAFGFRDQLQDTIALAHSGNDLARQQILLCGSRQFIEGDVQHWWHPPSGKGIRTRCSDDYLWLPFVVAHYVRQTGDTGILDEIVPFLDGREVHPTEDSYYDLPIHSQHCATLYLHCVHAIEHGLRFGEHGLPLIGSCDWNDGMDKVGNHGTGESVWLGFFLYSVLIQFSELADKKGDSEYANHCKQQALMIRQNIERAGWDGEWYRRAYFDDGSPLGASNSKECQIDSLSQSWAVLSGAVDLAHQKIAMESLYHKLLRKSDRVLPLLDPPFDRLDKSPGYISGYLPGIRENGGQYNHAAVWVAMAFAKMGETAKAWEIHDLINPIKRSNSFDEITRYKVEPYVLSGDIYTKPPHTGRGGWTWYTGSAGWMYTLITQSLLGLYREGDFLLIDVNMPENWNDYQIRYRYLGTQYLISVHRHDAIEYENMMYIDGLQSQDMRIHLIDDGKTHQIRYLIKN